MPTKLKLEKKRIIIIILIMMMMLGVDIYLFILRGLFELLIIFLNCLNGVFFMYHA
jgi:hypothetical protein